MSFKICIISAVIAVSVLFTASAKDPVDYVNPNIGNISIMLVPTFPTVQLPNSMLRMIPSRPSYVSDTLRGLPGFTTGHRGRSCFSFSPWTGNNGKPLADRVAFTYDNEKTLPYRYNVYLENQGVSVDFAPSFQSAVYSFDFEATGQRVIVVNAARNGNLSYSDGAVKGYEDLGNRTRSYIFAEPDSKPVRVGYMENGKAVYGEPVTGKRTILLDFGNKNKVSLRYGVSYIDESQAEKNLRREINHFDIEKLAKQGRDEWNKALGKIQVEGGSENEKAVFYTALYRTYERMVCISEDGRYFSGYDKSVHSDNGIPFFVDDWIWDTYRAVHPLRVIIEPTMENHMIESYVRMAVQSPEGWMPTFPEVERDHHAMNGNHAVAMIADALAKGLTGFNIEAAYNACYKSIMEETQAPWSRRAAGEFDEFYKKNGYFPALRPGQEETYPEVHSWERRQSVAVTQAAAYDDWCLAKIAERLNKKEDKEYFEKRSFNYRNLFNPETKFFHPKDDKGEFITPFDYRTAGGLGGRDYYDENNGWIYRWDVPHNIPDLVNLMGGGEAFATELSRMYNEELGMAKWEFWAILPDHTGNVGQYSMGNEPSLHIPYLYNYAGKPWETQKRVRQLLEQWFRNDLMGIPGDEDGGGLSAFVVFSSIGFYPVTPGSSSYDLGSPVFSKITINLENGKTFVIDAKNASSENKYIQKATINGKVLDKPWFDHKDIASGGTLVLDMDNRPNKDWGK